MITEFLPILVTICFLREKQTIQERNEFICLT